MRFLSRARVLLAVAVAMLGSGAVHTVAAQATGTVSGRVVEQARCARCPQSRSS
jgi:hypothetical protein